MWRDQKVFSKLKLSRTTAYNKPAWAHPFAYHIRWDFEDDVTDVEDGQDGIVIISLESQVLFEACDFCIS
jgi:hypothetical protein